MWYFKTRDGAVGILQIVSFTNDPAAAKIRYKLVQGSDGEGITRPVEVNNAADETLADRLQAALMMRDYTIKDSALSKVALDAANAGNTKVATEALQKMSEYTARDQAAFQTARALARHRMRKAAIETAKTISDFTIRDQALAELANQ